MNRNTELHMGQIPKIHLPRSKFDESHSISTTYNVGDVIPFFVDPDITAGDTVELDLSEITRLQTPIVPTMDNLIVDYYFFFCPSRLVWEHWVNFWGENDDEWTPAVEYEIPQLEAPSGGWAKGTIADYFGIPTYVDNISVNALPFRAYAKIWSDWFRSEPLKKSAHYYKDDTTRTGTNSGSYVTNAELGALPCKAAKTADYFTMALPTPQRGPSVALPLGTSAPVHTTNNIHSVIGEPGVSWAKTADNGHPPVGNMFIYSDDITYGSTEANTATKDKIAPTNLEADLYNATAATISELRTAFAIQRYYEQMARSGGRYIEVLRAIFGTESSDARMQRSEYLGGVRVPVNMDSIVQTSSTDATSPQGHASGYSCTLSKHNIFTKSFEEHGILIGMLVARVNHHSYQQGIPKGFLRKKWTDFYNPFFAHLSEQPITNNQIYAQGSTIVDTDGNIIDEQVFGYQEAWAEYRYKPNIVTGEMRSNSPNGSQDIYHYADDYASLPMLDGDWIDEPLANVDRTIAVASSVADQFKTNIWMKMSYTRGMPVFSVPGLIDHV